MQLTRYATTLLLPLLVACNSSETSTNNQTSNNLNCNGTFYGYLATVSGTRRYEAYNALGDGYVIFNGTMTAADETAPMHYEGYTATAPFEGTVQASSGTIGIAVLDATSGGNTMIIYDNTPTLGAPTTLGTLTCSWS